MFERSEFATQVGVEATIAEEAEVFPPAGGDGRTFLPGDALGLPVEVALRQVPATSTDESPKPCAPCDRRQSGLFASQSAAWEGSTWPVSSSVPRWSAPCGC